MAELRPYPLAGLVTRMFRELRAEDSIFGLPRKRFFLGAPDLDLSVRFHGKRASSPLGPAAGPHTQMAQNIVLAWLGGCRILELKTVQILDELEIGRPCIDMQTIGYNIEWSQELKLEESLDEYVKAMMLIEMLRASGELELAPGFDDAIYDMSVGYDLKGIQHPRVQHFIRGMLDAAEGIERFRGEIPDEFRALRDLEYPTRISDTLTLSTFHGCPPDEIEGIIDFLLREMGLHCVIKLNPTLLGQDDVDHLLHDKLGYREAKVPASAFEKDARWDQMTGFVRRLKDTANGLGLGLGVKFTNTLIVQNHRDFFPPDDKEMYLSGPPLHVLAMQLVSRMREHFGDEIPISFSAGIDPKNFPDAVALGLVPITVCSDLLKPGGYGRAARYFTELMRRMRQAEATCIDDFVLRGHESPETELPAARVDNSRRYAAALPDDPRYALAHNQKLPKKIGSHLELFDCITCDKCIPVCPNHANFTFTLPAMEIPRVMLSFSGDRWEQGVAGTLKIEERHQIGNFVDFCNDCGNCDVFCPEDGGPYVVKPRFFSSLEAWSEKDAGDGFSLTRNGEVLDAAGRFQGIEYHASFDGGQVHYRGPGFEIEYREDDPVGTASGHADGSADLTFASILRVIADHVLAADAINYLTCGHTGP